MPNPGDAKANTSKTRVGTVSRRAFLGGMAATATAAIVPRHVLGGEGHVAPNDKTTLAAIGVGGQGTQNLNRLQGFPEIQVLAVCDVNRGGGGYVSWNWTQGKDKRVTGRDPARRMVEEHYAKQKGVGKYQGCKAYADYRELFDKEDVDAVMIATPDHIHAAAMMDAFKRGAHVYCEKPLTHSVSEARQVVEAARRWNVATQLGNHGQAEDQARLVQEYILDDAIGPVHEAHITFGAPFWPQSPWGGHPPEKHPVPDGLDWDLWLGPAPARPYHPAYHPWSWRDWRDFGTGPLGDMGCHLLSTVFKALKLTYPTSVEATCTEIGPELYPRRFEVRWEFPQREGMPPVALTWHGGGTQPPRPKELEPGRKPRGTMYIGEKGTLMGNQLIPGKRNKQYGKPPEVLARSAGHDKEWIDACRGGPRAGSDFVNHGGFITETAMLGNIAMSVGKKLEWDGPNMRFTNDDLANRYLRRAYRAGWSL